MGKVHVIKFQGVIEHEEKNCGLQYKQEFVDMKNCFYLKYFRHFGNSDYFEVSDDYSVTIGSRTEIEFIFDRTVRVVGYSTDVPLILNINGVDQGVLMPNYVGTAEILPIASHDIRFAFSTVGYIIGIASGMVIKVREGT